MRLIKQEVSNRLVMTGIRGYFEKTVTKFGNGAKVDAPKEHIGKKVIVIVYDSE
jgi:putative transposon-encoded protein